MALYIGQDLIGKVVVGSSGGTQINNQDKSVTPTESQQVVTFDSAQGYTGLGTVTVNAISSTYVGSDVPQRDGADLTASGPTVSVPSGFYADNETKSVASGSVTAPASVSGTSATVSVGTNTLTFSKTVSITPNVTSAGYVSSGTAGNSSVSLTAAVNTRSSSDLTVSGDTVNVPSGFYNSNSSKAVASGTAGTPTATKGTVSNHSVSVTPSVTNTTGYITGSTKTGTAVTVSASELVSGSQTITQNSTVDVTNLAQVVVNVSGGGSGMNVATATATPSTANSSISFTGLSGEPTSFYVVSAGNLATGASPYKTSAVVFDGTDIFGQYVTNTSNAQVTYSNSAFSKSYSSGTLTITGTGTNFQANQYKLVYTYGGSSSNIGTVDVQVGSGATSITFTGLSDEPSCFSCVFKSNFSTSSGYTRAMAVVFDGTSVYGLEMGSGATASSNWSYTYNNGSLTISSQSTSAGGYFHQPGYYQLTYGVGGEISIEVEPLTATQNGTYSESGKAYSPVIVNVSGGGGTVQFDSKTATAGSDYPVSLSFTSMKGQPKMFAVRLNAQVSSSGNTTYYYIVDMVYNGTGIHGNCFRIGSTRRVDNITSGYSWSYSGTTLTVTSSAASRSASPGAFYSGSYELIYCY